MKLSNITMHSYIQFPKDGDTVIQRRLCAAISIMKANMNSVYPNDETYKTSTIPSDHEAMTSYAQEDAIYRGMAIPESYQFDFKPYGYSNLIDSNSIDKPLLFRDSGKKLTSLNASPPSSSAGFKSVTPSPLPDVLVLTNFTVNSNITDIQMKFEKFLSESSNLSYELDDSKAQVGTPQNLSKSFPYSSYLLQWTVVYINGPSHCKFHVTLYEKNIREYIVEANRLMGDAFAFRTLYKQMKGVLSVAEKEFREFDSFSTTSVPMPSFTYEEEVDYSHNINYIFNMYKDGSIEADLEVSRSLCDLSNDITMQQVLVDRGCLTILKEIICGSFCEWAKQHAIIALSNLSDAKIYQAAIIKTGILSELLKLACDGPYHTAELRRSAVHILANICNDSSPEVLKVLGIKEISTWMKQVDNFKDERMKVYASRAKDSLSRAVYAI